MSLKLDMPEFIHPYDRQEGDGQRSLHLNRYNWAKEMIKGSVVANAACSTNYGYEILKTPGRLVMGFDRNDSALDVARKNNWVFFVRKDIQDETFDGFTTLVCLETFEHLPNPWDFISGLSSTVKELVLSTPIIPTKHFNEWHLHDFSEEEVVEGLRSHGWEIERASYQDEDGLQKPTYLLIYATR